MYTNQPHKVRRMSKRKFIMVEVSLEEQAVAKKLAKAKHTDVSKMVREMIRRSAKKQGITA